MSSHEKTCEDQFTLQEEERMHSSYASVGLKVMTIRIRGKLEKDTVVIGGRQDKVNSTEEK